MSSVHYLQSGLNISVREFRLVVERILYLTGLPKGAVPAVRDTILYAEAFGTGGLERLRDDFESLKKCRADAFRVTEQGDRIVLDGAGQHAWIVTPVALDLAVEVARSPIPRALHIQNVFWPEGLNVLDGLCYRHGIVTRVESGETSIVTARSNETRTDPVMLRIAADHLRISGTLWWELFELSNQSLTRDSAASRRHAGPIVVTEDGRMIGRQEDEDTDITVLTAVETEQVGHVG
jgi:hypothetical protein